MDESTEAILDLSDDTQQARLHGQPMHRWWAVRPKPLADAAALLALLRDSSTFFAFNPAEDLAAAAGLEGGIKPRLLDVFSGTGAIAGAAAKRGCEATALELNPVAHLIARCAWELPCAHGMATPEPGIKGSWLGLGDEIEYWASRVAELAAPSLAALYDVDIAAYVWSDWSRCPACGQQAPFLNERSLGPDLWLDVSIDGDEVVVQSRPRSIAEGSPSASPGHTPLRCPRCGRVFTRESERSKSVERPVGAFRTDREGFTWVPATTASMESWTAPADRLIREVSARLKAERSEELPAAGTRQRATLLAFSDAIVTVHAELVRSRYRTDHSAAIVSCLGVILSALVPWGSREAIWDSRRRAVRLHGRFSAPARGAFAEPGALAWKKLWQRQTSRSIAAIRDATPLAGTVATVAGNATQLPFRDAAFDAIVCDPPYFDNIDYAEAADSHYGWMRLVLAPLYPEIFAASRSPRAAEIVVHRQAPDREAERRLYEESIRLSIAEAARVLKPDRCMAVLYAASDATQLSEFLALIQPGGIELAEVVR
jgi:putative DNA methylase